jgi:hypothetical protein
MSEMAFARKMLSNFVNRLRQDRSGVAVIELAYSLPILMVLGVTGAETAYYVQTQQQISQIALAAADNASRVGEAGVLQTRRVYESDINDIFLGAPKQFGDPNFFDNARIIISSVEYDADDNIYIHWQRCMGEKDVDSEFGPEGTGLGDDTLEDGINTGAARVKPVPGSALIVAEVSYDFQALFGISPYVSRELKAKGVFVVRDARDLTGLYDKTGEDPVATCA